LSEVWKAFTATKPNTSRSQTERRNGQKNSLSDRYFFSHFNALIIKADFFGKDSIEDIKSNKNGGTNEK
jgi:hypothetical protein